MTIKCDLCKGAGSIQRLIPTPITCPKCKGIGYIISSIFDEMREVTGVPIFKREQFEEAEDE